MPLQVIVGEKNVANGNVEIKERMSGNRSIIPIASVVSHVQQYFAS
jgi:histidyl-tRNA synthetase